MAQRAWPVRLSALTLLDMVDCGFTWKRIVASWPLLTPQHAESARQWRRERAVGRQLLEGGLASGPAELTSEAIGAQLTIWLRAGSRKGLPVTAVH